MVMGKLRRAWRWCMGGAWRGDGLGLAYLGGGVVGLVRLDLEVGVWFWMRYGDQWAHFVKNHWKSGQKCQDFKWFSFQMVGTIAIAIARARTF